MKQSKFTEAQIALVLKQAEGGTRVEEVCRKIGINDSFGISEAAKAATA